MSLAANDALTCRDGAQRNPGHGAAACRNPSFPNFGRWRCHCVKNVCRHLSKTIQPGEEELTSNAEFHEFLQERCLQRTVDSVLDYQAATFAPMDSAEYQSVCHLIMNTLNILCELCGDCEAALLVGFALNRKSICKGISLLSRYNLNNHNCLSSWGVSGL